MTLERTTATKKALNVFDSGVGSENGGTNNGCSDERVNNTQREVDETNAAALNSFRALQAGPIRQGSTSI